VNNSLFRGRNSFYTFLVIAILASIIIVSAGFEFFASRRFREVEQRIQDYIAADSNGNDSELDAEKLTNIQKTLVDIKSAYSELRGARLILDAMGVFVVVGGGVGGYLLSQAQSNEQRRRELERQAIDTMVSDIIKELSSPKEQEVLRASAAVKFGQILDEFPAEWEFFGDENQKKKRQNQIRDLIKSVLSTALSIETNASVLKRIAENLNKHTLASSEASGYLLLNLDSNQPTIKKLKDHPEILKDYPAINKLVANLQVRANASKGNKDKGFVDMRYLDLSNANANIEAAKAREVSGFYWPRCLFDNTDFHNAQLNHSSLKNSYFRGIRFRNTSIQKSNVSESFFEECSFNQTKLKGSIFSDSVFFEKTKFKNTECAKANFSGCYLQRAIFEDANFSGVNFAGADLTNAKFDGVDLSQADFRGAILTGTTFRDDVKLDGAHFDS
jgi:uncharacterized protein YjbI with pentapeptide repeats